MQTGVGMGGGVRNFWIMQDVNYNVMGVLSDGPASVGPRLVERYEYTPYGRRTVFSHGFLAADFNGDGTVDDADYTIYGDSYGDTGLCWFLFLGLSRILIRTRARRVSGAYPAGCV